jgi:hypothetical protein
MNTVNSEYVAEKLKIKNKSAKYLLSKAGAKIPKSINIYDKEKAIILINKMLEELRPIEEGVVSRDDLIKEYAVSPRTIDAILRVTPVYRIYTERESLFHRLKLWKYCDIYPHLKNAKLRSEYNQKKTFIYDSNIINFLSGNYWKIS